MVALAGSVAAAEALIAGIAATPAAASISKTDDPRLKTGRQTYTLGESRRLDVYTAEPVAGMARNRAAVIVIHENRGLTPRSEEHTSELQSLMRISYAVFCLKKKKKTQTIIVTQQIIYINTY